MSHPIQPLNLAIHAYTFARLVRLSQGASDLPEWDLIPSHKQLHFTNAAKAALRGAPVWDVWALSVGEVPNDAHSTLWRQKQPVYQLIPSAIHAFGEAIRGLVPSPVPAPESVPPLEDTGSDLPPEIEEDPEDPDAEYGPVDTTAVEEAVEEHGLGSEEVAEALTEANGKARKKK